MTFCLDNKQLIIDKTMCLNNSVHFNSIHTFEFILCINIFLMKQLWSKFSTDYLNQIDHILESGVYIYFEFPDSQCGSLVGDLSMYMGTTV